MAAFAKHATLGTVEQNRVGIPAELKDAKEREVHSTTCHYEQTDKQLCLNTYAVKTKSSGKKNVFMLTTLRPLPGITKDDEKEKPSIYKLYDFTKGGTVSWISSTTFTAPVRNPYGGCVLRYFILWIQHG